MTVDNLAVLENIPGIVFHVAVEHDGDFRFLSMSHEGLVAMGLSREEVVGALVRNVIPLTQTPESETAER